MENGPKAFSSSHHDSNGKTPKEMPKLILYTCISFITVFGAFSYKVCSFLLVVTKDIFNDNTSVVSQCVHKVMFLDEIQTNISIDHDINVHFSSQM